MVVRTWSRKEQVLYIVVITGLTLFPRPGEHHVAVHLAGVVVLVAAAIAYRRPVAPSIIVSSCAVLLVDILYGWWFWKPRVPIEPLWVVVAVAYVLVMAVVIIDDARRRRTNAT